MKKREHTGKNMQMLTVNVLERVAGNAKQKEGKRPGKKGYALCAVSACQGQERPLAQYAQTGRRNGVKIKRRMTAEELKKRYKSKYDKKHWAEYRAKGICPCCRVNRAIPGKALCVECARAKRENAARFYRKRKAAGYRDKNGRHKVYDYDVWVRNDQAVRMEHLGIRVIPYHFDVSQGGFIPILPCNFRSLRNWILFNELKYQYIVGEETDGEDY